MNMCESNFPLMAQLDGFYNDVVMQFENYESKVDALDINDTEGLRSVIREIPLDDYRPSLGNKMLLESAKANGETIKESTLNEDELIGLIQRLRRDDTGTGKTNLRYMSEFKPNRNKNLKDFQQILLEEKEEEEKEYYSKKNEYDECNSYYASSSNSFLNEIDELK
jgi:hypothetical protein